MSSGVPRPRLSSIRWPTIAAMSSRVIDPLLAVQLDAHPLGDRSELLVELVAADPAEVVAAEVEEQALDELAGVVAGGRIARAQLLVDLDQGLVLGLGQVLVEGRRRCTGAPGRCRRREQAGDLVVGARSRSARSSVVAGDLALAVDLDREQVLVAGLELEPGAAVRDDLGRVQRRGRWSDPRPRCSRRPASGRAG